MRFICKSLTQTISYLILTLCLQYIRYYSKFKVCGQSNLNQYAPPVILSQYKMVGYDIYFLPCWFPAPAVSVFHWENSVWYSGAVWWRMCFLSLFHTPENKTIPLLLTFEMVTFYLSLKCKFTMFWSDSAFAIHHIFSILQSSLEFKQNLVNIYQLNYPLPASYSKCFIIVLDCWKLAAVFQGIYVFYA